MPVVISDEVVVGGPKTYPSLPGSLLCVYHVAETLQWFESYFNQTGGMVLRCSSVPELESIVCDQE